MDLVGEREDARQGHPASDAIRAAAALPGEGWSGLASRPPSGEVNPIGPGSRPSWSR